MSYYTASFSLGTMLSFLVVGEVARRFGWQAAFALSGLAALAGFALVTCLAPVHPEKTERPGKLLDFRPVFKNRAAMGFILGYVCHRWELFTFRAWMVAFLVFAQSRAAAGEGLSPTTVATLCSAVAMISSLVGADLALRFDRKILCVCAMVGSGGMAMVLGGCLMLPYGVAVAAAVLYTALVQLDSAALTTGAMLAADQARRGATVALHSLLGFSSAFFGPLAQGSLLDIFGGASQVRSWVVAFAVMGGVGLLGPFALIWGRAKPSAESSL
jgi:MFS family permease